MSDEDRNIDCPEHGSTVATYVCQHLATGQGQGFHVGLDPDAPDALWPDAWCDACETVLLEEGEWNDTPWPMPTSVSSAPAAIRKLGF